MPGRQLVESSPSQRTRLAAREFHPNPRVASKVATTGTEGAQHDHRPQTHRDRKRVRACARSGDVGAAIRPGTVSGVACPACRRRAALIAELAPAIERIEPLTRQSLLGLLALSDDAICRAMGAKLPRAAAGARESPNAVCRHDAAYPQALAQLECAPAVVHTTCKAERLAELLAAPAVAIVGRRVHTDYAHRVTFALARDLAEAGVTIVSGLHQGIDGIAHHGAMHAGGSSIAVTGCGPERPYPRQLEHLHRRARARGAIVSEMPPGHYPPQRWSLIASQRIIAGIAEIIVVVEAEERSSAMLTAQIAADLGHEVAAVPGRVTDRGGKGTFALIRDGAHPVGGAQDVLDLIDDSSRARAAAAA